MLILFDHGTPAPLAPFLEGHTVKRAKQLGWQTLVNGELLTRAEDAGFDLLLTTDQNIQHQQNLTGRKIAIVVLGNPQWPVLRRYTDLVASKVNAARPGSFTLIEIPRE